MDSAEAVLRLAGFLLLLAGWALVIATLALLRPGPPRAGFVLAGVAVEIVGMILVARFHLPVAEDRE